MWDSLRKNRSQEHYQKEKWRNEKMNITTNESLEAVRERERERERESYILNN